MTYISANIVGIFFIGLLIFDMLNNKEDLPVHAAIGILVTALYTGVCYLLGEAISSAVLFVPGIFLAAFLLASWLLRNNLITQNCCVTCKGKSLPPCAPKPVPKPTPTCKPKCPPVLPPIVPSTPSSIYTPTPFSITPSSGKCKPAGLN
jgi:hypothetical protein